MSTIRIHKNKNFTVMSNVHLRDKNLSLKAKGLLSVMLSLPENWNYSIAGLCAICKENETAIKSALKELKESQYVIVQKENPSKENNGRIKYRYEVYEEPQSEKKQIDEKQCAENLPAEFLGAECHSQLNTKELNTEKLNTNNIKITSPSELNSFSKEKDKSPAGLNSSFHSERKEESAHPTSDKWVATKTHIISTMKRLGYKHDSRETEDAVDVFKYYYRKYRQKIGDNHPRLNDKTMFKTLDNFVNPPGSLKGYGTDPDTYMQMIDKHFETQYREQIDWNIQHFMVDTIREKVFHQACD